MPGEPHAARHRLAADGAAFFARLRLFEDRFRKENRNVEMEDSHARRIVVRSGRRRLGIRAAAEGYRVLRAANLHGSTGKERRARGPLCKPNGCNLREAWNHKRGLLDSARE